MVGCQRAVNTWNSLDNCSECREAGFDHQEHRDIVHSERNKSNDTLKFLTWKAITILLFNNNNNNNKHFTFLTWKAGMLVLPWCKPGPLSTPVKSGSVTITMNDGTGNGGTGGT